MSQAQYEGEQIRRQYPEEGAKGSIAGAGTADPWAMRTKGMKCMTCIWFVPKERAVSLGNSHVGRCRRHAPTMNGYPVVYMTDWCGDHRIDENKV
jgi:hypothetical protein